jgi:Phage tail protein (Tail_P2_I)
MSLLMPERLYKLLPAIHRLRDADQGEPLRALLGVVEGELERVEADIANLYDNWFIETCDEWVVPYLGDLLGVRGIRPVASAGVSARAYVANTIAYRRRKGTAVVLEQLARDVTGWPARAVEFFQRLATAQHMNHVRLAPTFTASVRDAAAAELADGPFDPYAHSAEVRRITTRGGRFNIPNVGLYLWRLRSYALGAGAPGDEAPDFTSARDLGAWWSIHPAGVDAPLFNRPRTETTITHLAEEQNVPGPLRRLALNAELERLRLGIAEPAPRFMTADDPVLRVFVRLAGESAPAEMRREDIYLCEIPDDVELGSPQPRALALDPARGRIAFPAGLPVQEVWVQSSYGFSGDLGGGPYERTAAVRDANRTVGIELSGTGESGGFDDPTVWQTGVSHLIADDGSGTLFPTLRAAVEAWNQLPAGRTGVIVLMDSVSDFDTAAGSPAAALEIELGERSRLLVVAGTWPLEPIPGAPPGSVARMPGHFDAQQIRAHFVGDIVLRGTAAAASLNAGACFVNGLMLEGQLVVAPGNLGRLDFAHGTLVPGRGALVVQPGGNERLTLAVDHAICAAVSVPGPVARLTVADSIVGSGEGSPDLSLDAPEAQADLLHSSFFGGVTVQSVSASDCIFGGLLHVERRQTGCVRFSFVPPGSVAPRRYRCQPELEATTRIAALRDAAREENRPPPGLAEEAAIRAEVRALIQPLFVSRRYGDPGYGQLELRCAAQIRSGAESGAEMGAFEFLKQPQREANLRDVLDEYLRFGLEAGLFYVT